MARKVDVGAMLSGVSELDTGSMRVRSIPLDQLRANDNNFFAVQDVQELADNIALHGLDNPLTVCRAERLPDGRQIYRIVAGHRRCKAVQSLGWPAVPCNVKTYEDADSEEIALIQSNMTARTLTYYERMTAVVRLSEAYARLKARGEALPGRLRDYVARESNQSATSIQRMTYIYSHLSGPLMEHLKHDALPEAVADAMAHCPEDLQADFAARLDAGEILNTADVLAARERQQSSETVSAADPPEVAALKDYYKQIRREAAALKDYYKQIRREAAVDPHQATAPPAETRPGLIREDVIKLTNIAKREAVLDRWQEWPVWVDVPEIGLTVHRLDLPDGSAFTACWYAGDDYFPYGTDTNVNRPRFEQISKSGKLKSGGCGRSVLTERLQVMRKELMGK